MDRQKLLDRHKRYNTSRKGQKRYKRYEAKHPERKERWSQIMLIRRSRNWLWAVRMRILRKTLITMKMTS